MSGAGAFIGEVSRQTGLSIHTIRFYEAEKLLPEPTRTESGYRLFSPEAVEHLQFIRKAQQLGFSLDEIRELLILRDSDTEACSHVRAVIDEKLVTVRAKLRGLAAMEKDLLRVRAECDRQLRKHQASGGEKCPVLSKLGRGGKDR